VRTLISALLPTQAKEFIKTVLRRATPRWVTRAQEQRAERRYAAEKRPIGKDEIRADLQALPLPPARWFSFTPRRASSVISKAAPQQ
jgi:hypothetical protein